MNPQAMQALIDDLGKALGTKRPRRPHGFWVPYAWAVKALVSRNFSVNDAAKHVLRNAGLAVNAADLNCLRVVYYKVRDEPWPAGLYEALMGLEPSGGGESEETVGVDSALPEGVSFDLGGDDPTLSDHVAESGNMDDPVPESPVEDDPIPEDLRAELAAELESGFIAPVGPDPDADPDYVPEDEEFEI